MVAAISLILAVDVERALRRMAERGGTAEVVVRVVDDGLPGDVGSHLRDGVVDTLARCVVTIEPAALASSVVVEAA